MPTRTGLPTIAEHLQLAQGVMLICRRCEWRRELDLAALAAAGEGDRAVRELGWRCERCNSVRIAVTIQGERSARGVSGSQAG